MAESLGVRDDDVLTTFCSWSRSQQWTALSDLPDDKRLASTASGADVHQSASNPSVPAAPACKKTALETGARPEPVDGGAKQSAGWH